MLPLVGLLQVFGRFVLCALRVITGALRELVFIHRAVAKGGIALQADKNEYRGLIAGLEGISGKKAVNTDPPGK